METNKNLGVRRARCVHLLAYKDLPRPVFRPGKRDTSNGKVGVQRGAL
jgi:hypothetical protein